MLEGSGVRGRPAHACGLEAAGPAAGAQNEKRQLETALVVEGTQAAAMKHRLTSGEGGWA